MTANRKEILSPKHFVKSVRIWSYSGLFSRIWTEYGEIRSISLYSVRMWENADQNITPNTDAFRSVKVLRNCESLF